MHIDHVSKPVYFDKTYLLSDGWDVAIFQIGHRYLDCGIIKFDELRPPIVARPFFSPEHK